MEKKDMLRKKNMEATQRKKMKESEELRYKKQ